MKYQVIGADDVAGSERDVIIEADSEIAAVARAKGHGIVAYRVQLCAESLPKPECPSTGLPNWKSKAERDRDETLLRGLVLIAGVAIVVLGCTGVANWVAAPSSFQLDTARTRSIVPPASYSDPRDKRWDSPAGREFIRSMSREAGVSEEKMRQTLNDDLDRRGLSDWADGKR